MRIFFQVLETIYRRRSYTNTQISSSIMAKDNQGFYLYHRHAFNIPEKGFAKQRYRLEAVKYCSNMVLSEMRQTSYISRCNCRPPILLKIDSFTVISQKFCEIFNFLLIHFEFSGTFSHTMQQL